MVIITSKEDFEGLLRQEQVILFCFFEWSGQAKLSLRLFEQWENEWKASHPNASIAFYRLNPDLHPYTLNWISKHARSEEGIEGGFGSVIWIRRGEGVGFVRYAAAAGKDTLSRLTQNYFESAQ